VSDETTPVLELRGITKTFGSVEALSDVDLDVGQGEVMALVGDNGAGKSTLIKTIAGELAPLAGTANFNKGLVVGYFAQHQVEMLRDDQSPLWHLQRIAHRVRDQELRST